MARLADENGEIDFVDDNGVHCFVDDVGNFTCDQGDASRKRYVAFNMCWALLALLPLFSRRLM